MLSGPCRNNFSAQPPGSHFKIVVKLQEVCLWQAKFAIHTLQEDSCLFYGICVCLHVVVCNTYCVVFLFCFSSICVLYVASFSELYIFYFPFCIGQRLCTLSDSVIIIYNNDWPKILQKTHKRHYMSAYGALSGEKNKSIIYREINTQEATYYKI